MSYSKGWVIRLAYAKHFLKSHSEKTSTLFLQKTCIARLSPQTEPKVDSLQLRDNGIHNDSKAQGV